MHPRRIILFTIVLILVSGCTTERKQIQLYTPWNASDVRAISSSQILPKPSQDISAIYIRKNGPEWQIRLDFLDISSPPDCDIYLAMDTKTGGATDLPLDTKTALQWDTLVIIPASGKIRALSPDPLDTSHILPRSGMRIRVFRDPVMDKIEISLNRAALKADLGFRLQVFVTPAGSIKPSDSLGPVRSDGPSPPQVNVLLAFWNSMPAYTPAQALRRWDGAHTGPLGGRHGLNNLLHASRSTKTTLTLLDLKLPASLAALDSVQGTKYVDKSSALGLLIIPDNLPGFASRDMPAPLPDWSQNRFFSDSRQTGLEFGLPTSQFSFAPLGLGQTVPAANSSTRVLFIPASPNTPELEPVTMMRWGNLKVIPIPGYGSQTQPAQQASLDGPTLSVRRALVRAATSKQGNPAQILVLGGDLPATVWGNPNAAIATMKYLSGHPWVHIMNAHDLLAANPDKSATELFHSQSLPSSDLANSVVEKIHQAPENPPGLAAWQMYQALFAPAYPTPLELPALRASYLGQVNTLPEAASWAACTKDDLDFSTYCLDPEKILVDCSLDLDLDQQPECLLASKNFFGVFETIGSYLSFAFWRDPNGNVHQIIAPSSELVLGLSESATWDLSAGVGADPEVVPGAFSSLTPMGAYDFHTVYQVVSLADGITLTSPDGTLSKTFRLSSEGLSVAYQISTPVHTQIPLVLDPWLRFLPGWMNNYKSGQEGQSWYWSVQLSAQSQTGSSTDQINSFKIEIHSSAEFSTQTFKDAQDILTSPENPNRENPPGHFLPFPMAMVEIDASQNFSVRIDFSNVEK
jgi:hypothetical protein